MSIKVIKIKLMPLYLMIAQLKARKRKRRINVTNNKSFRLKIILNKIIVALLKKLWVVTCLLVNVYKELNKETNYKSINKQVTNNNKIN